MKRKSTVFMSLLLLLGFALPGFAATVSPYSFDFNKAIDTNDKYFKPASNWSNLANSGSATYKYHADKGRESSGCLEVYNQYAGDYGCLITPTVWGKVSLWVKYTGSGANVYMYKYNEAAQTLGEVKVSRTVAYNESGEWIEVTVTIPESEKCRLAIKPKYLYIDDFSAEHADITPEKILKIKTYNPNQTTGTLYWAEKPDSTVDIKFTNVTVENVGDLDLSLGDKDLSMTLLNDSNLKVMGDTIPIPQALTVGQTSDPFDLTFNVHKDKFNYNTTLLLRENCSDSYVKLVQSQIIAYKVDFIFNEANKNAYSSTTAPQTFGIKTEAVTKNYEIRNAGGKDCVIKSITVPDGFSISAPTGSTLPTCPFTLKYNEKQLVDITMNKVAGAHTGNLEIVYINTDGTDKTYSIPLSGTIIGANTWFADFNNNGNQVKWPYGCVAENNISSASKYVSMDEGYDHWLRGQTFSDYQFQKNKFITPKLHANAGDKMSFTIGRSYSDNNATFRVYKSTDRENWGEPLMNLTKDDITYDPEWETKTITFDEEGDYYIGFALYGYTKLDNIVGLEKVDVDHDLFIRDINQKEYIRTGIADSFKLEFIPCTDENYDSYSVKLIFEPVDGGDNHEFDLPSNSVYTLSGTAGSTYRTYEIKPTVEVEETTLFNTYWKFIYNDGSTYTTPVKQVTVANEPEFLFLNGNTTVSNTYKPDNITGPIKYGKINKNADKTFMIYNYGMAPLTVKSVVCPEGFSTDFAEETVIESKSSINVKITALAEEAGEYDGNVIITYVDAAGDDAIFEIEAISHVLDPTKWYANFNGATSSGEWPKGAINSGLRSSCIDYASLNCVYYYNDTKDAFMITPKMNIVENDELSFLVKACSSYTPGEVEIYYADTREKIKDPELRESLTRVMYISSKADEEEATKFDNNEFKEFKAVFPEAGQYYVGIVVKSVYLDDFFGLSVAPIEGLDLSLESATFPKQVMQNNVGRAEVKLLNFGVEDVEPSDYNITVYVDGEEVRTVAGEKLVTKDSYTSAPTAVTIPFRSPLVGTYDVYAKLRGSDNYELVTDTVQVEFTPEVASSDVVVGDFYNCNGSLLFSNYQAEESVSIYSAEYLGLNGGDRIVSMKLKGYSQKDKEDMVMKVAYKFVDEAVAPNAAEPYDLDGFTIIQDGVFDDGTGAATYNFVSENGYGKNDQPEVMFSFDFEEPIVYQEGKSLLLYTLYWTNNWQGGNSIYIAAANKVGENKTWYRKVDCKNNEFETKLYTKAFSDQVFIPMLYIGLDVQPTFLTGNVTDNAGTAVADANVTLISSEGENIQYKGTTDENGDYSIQVIQLGRKYHTYATVDGKKGLVKEVDVTTAENVDLTVYDLVKVNTETAPVDNEEAYVEFDVKLKEGYNPVVLPFNLDSTEINDVFGENALVYELFAIEDNKVKFQPASRIKAGTPYLINVDEENASVDLIGKKVESRIITDGNMNVRFRGTYTAIPKAENHYIPDENMINGVAPANDIVVENETHAPYSAYLESNNGPLTIEVSDVVTAIEGIDAEDVLEVEIYDLNGLRVKNPKGGIYIVNGKKAVLN